MNYFRYAIALAIFFLAGYLFRGQARNDLTHKSISFLEGDREKANSDYDSCFEIRKKKISQLIGLVNNESIFTGDSYQNPISSYLGKKVSVGIIAMYAIDGLIKGSKHPYLAPLILSRVSNPSGRIPAETSSEFQQRAATIYINWYTRNLDMLGEEFNPPLPLSGSDLYWYGGASE